MLAPYNRPIQTNNNGNNTMDNLINKLSKADQRGVNMAMMHANNDNKAATLRVLDGMIRAANNRSAPILTAIRELV